MRSLYSMPFIALFFSLAAGVLSNDNNICSYFIGVQTGDEDFAGTDSTISLTLKESTGRFSVSVPDLTSWGAMPSGHNYFERDNLDMFSGQAPCLCIPVCNLTLTSDGKGIFPGWYVDYLNVTILNSSTNKGGHTMFPINQWLDDGALTAVIDQCNTATPSLDGSAKQPKNKRFAVGRLGLYDKSAAS